MNAIITENGPARHLHEAEAGRTHSLLIEAINAPPQDFDFASVRRSFSEGDPNSSLLSQVLQAETETSNEVRAKP